MTSVGLGGSKWASTGGAMSWAFSCMTASSQAGVHAQWASFLRSSRRGAVVEEY